LNKLIFNVIILIICITGMVIVGTYFKDKLEIKGRSSVDKLTQNKISITAEEKDSKN